MPTSNAVVSTQNMELTPMRVNFNGVDLGGTLSNVTVTSEFSKAEIKADQSGDTVRDRRVSGMNIQVTTEIAEIQNKDLWKVVFPHANLITSGMNKAVYFNSKIGDSDLANSKELVLHPLSKADADLSGNYRFWKACSDAKSEIVYGPTEQTKLKIVWNVLPDDSVTPERFFQYGDPSIGLISASAGSPVFTGTGGGTMGSVSVFSGFTKTEVITATCIHASAGAGIFQVSGSLSGPLGNATVGVGFSSLVIAFTIADGTPDFALNDSFTVATTAANYV